MQYQDEVFKQLTDYPGYSVSNYGRVTNRHGNQLRPYSNGSKKNYQKVKLFDAEGNKKQIYVHQLVLLTFGRSPVEGEEVNHINNDATCNTIWNLEWLTRKGNIEHKRINKFFTFDTRPQPLDLTRWMMA